MTDATAEIGILLILGVLWKTAEGIEAAKYRPNESWIINRQAINRYKTRNFRDGKNRKKIAKIAKSLGMIIHYHNRSKLSSIKKMAQFS